MSLAVARARLTNARLSARLLATTGLTPVGEKHLAEIVRQINIAEEEIQRAELREAVREANPKRGNYRGRRR